MSAAQKLKISEGQNEIEIKAQLDALLAKGWLIDEDLGLKKEFRFKTFTKVLVRKILF